MEIDQNTNLWDEAAKAICEALDLPFELRKRKVIVKVVVPRPDEFVAEKLVLPYPVHEVMEDFLRSSLAKQYEAGQESGYICAYKKAKQKIFKSLLSAIGIKKRVRLKKYGLAISKEAKLKLNDRLGLDRDKMNVLFMKMEDIFRAQWARGVQAGEWEGNRDAVEGFLPGFEIVEK